TVGSELWAIALRDSAFGTPSANAMGHLVRWTTGGWTRMRPRLNEGGGRACEIAVGSIGVAGSTDVWLSGAHSTGCDWIEPVTSWVGDLLHWDGDSWKEEGLPQEEQELFNGDVAAKLWIPKGSTRPWLVGRVDRGQLYRREAGGWEKVSLPDGHRVNGIGGTSDDDVWVTSSATDDAGTVEYLAIFRLQGGRFEEVFRTSGYHSDCDVVATSPSDVWVRASPGYMWAPRTTFHWNGTTWTDRGTLNADVIWPTGDGKAYFISNNDESADWMFALADSRYVLGYWDGATKTTLGETSASIRALTATSEALWIVGEGGATLRLPLAPSPR
ncbi:MAG: hypothetical protein K0S65_3484, partial [Labilithrix sp.]|nr:hypothetical protein [Labilithrix sp.]